ncbi:hypothetical protein [Streptomyces cyaneofuscatus]
MQEPVVEFCDAPLLREPAAQHPEALAAVTVALGDVRQLMRNDFEEH